MTESLAALPNLPRDAAGSVFAEPWEAQAFALASKLCEPGHFTWKERAAALAEKLKAAAERSEPDDGSRYDQHWLAAVERLVAVQGLSDPHAAGAQGSLGRCLPAYASRQAGRTSLHCRCKLSQR